MKSAYMKFRQLINDTSNAEVLYEYAERDLTPIDASDLLRWQWVQAVSALDKLIHDLVKVGMLEAFEGKRKRTNQYNKFSFDIELYTNMMANPSMASSYFEQQIIICNGYKSFQDPRRISEALSYIWDESDKWSIIANLIGMPKSDCTTRLNNIVIRRNQIVHEGDYIDILFKRQDIFETDVIEVKEFIIKIGEVIYNSVK